MQTDSTLRRMASTDVELEEQLAIDDSRETVFVEPGVHGSPRFLTWLQRQKQGGIHWKIEHAQRDQIAAYRAQGMRRAEAVEEDQRNQQLAYELVEAAAKYGASDIHLLMKGEHTEIQFVVNGGLRVWAYPSHKEGVSIAGAFYQGLAQTRDSTLEQRAIQHAQIPAEKLPPGYGLTSARIVRGPCYPEQREGSFMTIRLQYNETAPKETSKGLRPLDLPRAPAGNFNLEGRGFTSANLEKLDLLMSVPSGIVVVTGPTGSGKTTLMYELLKEKARRRQHRRQVTIEDPVEFPMDWATQLPVTNTRGDDENGAAFGEYSLAALRMAPNTLFFGELRGVKVALAALRGAQTGHDTWTTLHVSDPFQVPERIELMDPKGLDRRVLCDPTMLRGIIGTRLLPHLCPSCRIRYGSKPGALPKRIIHALRTRGALDKVAVRGTGCSECGQTGYIGRKAVVEVIINDDRLAADLIGRDTAQARRNYRARPGADLSILEEALRRVLDGDVDPTDVEDTVELIVPLPEETRLASPPVWSDNDGARVAASKQQEERLWPGTASPEVALHA